MKALKIPDHAQVTITTKANIRAADAIGIQVLQGKDDPVEVLYIDEQAGGKIVAHHRMDHQPEPQAPWVKEDGNSLVMVIRTHYPELNGLTPEQIVDGFRLDLAKNTFEPLPQ